MNYSLGNLSVTDLAPQSIVEQAYFRLTNKISTYIVTLNPEIFVAIQTDQALSELVESANYIVPDGQGIVWAISKLHKQRIGVCPGVELAELLLKAGIVKQSKIAVIGGTDAEITRASNKIISWGQNKAGLYTHDGYFNNEYDKIVSEIVDFAPSLVLVGMGFPKQDKLIQRLTMNNLTAIYIGIGGSIKIWAGIEHRAPEFVRKLRMEWVWRSFKDPARIKRLSIIPKYIALINKLDKQRHKVDLE